MLCLSSSMINVAGILDAGRGMMGILMVSGVTVLWEVFLGVSVKY